MHVAGGIAQQAIVAIELAAMARQPSVHSTDINGQLSMVRGRVVLTIHIARAPSYNNYSYTVRHKYVLCY